MEIETIEALAQDALAEIAAADSAAALEQSRVKWLGHKSPVRAALKTAGQRQGDDRVAFARRVNSLADQIASAVEQAKAHLSAREMAAQIEREWLDITLPATAVLRGARHPIREVERRCIDILSRLGFEQVEGPEIETSYFNFDALNIPQHHPARDMQDTFWVDEQRLLRTHTTSVQARILAHKPQLPIKAVVAGRVYRNEAVDATHLAMFHQLDGFWVDRGITFAHLKGVTSYLARALYGNRKLRYKPKFYPYTEPSLGIDIECALCLGQGCAACHGSGWVTIMGAGMVHRNVLREFGFDDGHTSGIAFGWGLSRMTTQVYGLAKLRPIYEGDLRLLHKLGGRTS